MTMTGRCQCGAVKFELASRPRRASICHCRMCQRASGSYFMPLANVPNGDFRITAGELAIYRSSPVAERGFCAACGSPLTFRYLELDGISVAIPALDDPDAVAPQKQYGIELLSPHCRASLDLPAETTDQSMPADWVARIAEDRHE